MCKHINTISCVVPMLALSLAGGGVHSATIEETLVTAQKREQSYQDVPLAVSAFQNDTMEKLRVQDIRGLVDLTPGFSGKTQDSFIDGLSLRGILTNDFGIGGDPSVAIFTDGMWSGRNGGVQMSFYDIERVEVVKGPQGTLFGRNAIGGGIQIITNKPTDEFEGNISVTAAQFDEIGGTGTVNIPLSEKWFFRGSVYGKSSGGYIENYAGGGDFGSTEVASTRLALRYAGDSVDAVIRATYEDREQDPSIYWTSRNGIPENKVNIDLKDGEGFDQSEIYSLQANVDWELSESFLLTSITGYKTYDFDYLEDTDGRPTHVNQYQQTQMVEYFSQEILLKIDTGDAISGFVGASYYQESIDATFTNSYNEDHLCSAIIDTDGDGSAKGCDDPVFEAYWGSDINPNDILSLKYETNVDHLSSDGWSVYGDVAWRLTEQLELSAGGRYTVDNKDMSIAVRDGGGALGNTLVFAWYTNGFVQDDNQWKKFTPRFALNYDINDQVSVYSSVAKGYKSGGYSTFGIVHDGTVQGGGELPANSKPLSFDPEEVLSVEIGAKASLFDNSMHLNTAIYSYDYKDLQLIVFDSGSQLVRNLGEAQGQGIEVDMHWTPGEYWDIRAAWAWQDTEITQELEVGDGTKGNQLSIAPETSGSLVVTYAYPAYNGNVFVTLQHVFQDDIYGGHKNFEQSKVDAWHETALRFGYVSNDELTLTLWVENITDELYFERGWEFAGTASDREGYSFVNTKVWPSKPRTIGLTIQQRF